MICLIVAKSKNNVIGNSNDLPWYLPADLRHFQKITTGSTIVMGRKTWQAILDRNGKPLPNRTNVIVTRDVNFMAEGAVVVHDIKTALKQSDNLFVIGGTEIFTQALPYVDRLYITEVDADIHGDAFFPELDSSQWNEISRESHPVDEKNQYPYSFVVLDRSHANQN